MSDEFDNHFVWLLGQLRKGRAAHDASLKLREVVEAVRNTGKGGELKLTIKVAPAVKRNAEMITITDDISEKIPQLDKGASLFFPIEGGGLSRKDPNQTEFPAEIFDREDKKEKKRRVEG